MALIDDWLATPNRNQCILVSFYHYDISLSTLRVSYVSNMAYQTNSGDTPASTQYHVCLINPLTINARLSSGYTGRAERTRGVITLENSDGHFDDLYQDSVSGRAVYIWVGDPTWSKSDFGLVLEGRITGMSSPNPQTITLEIIGGTHDLDVPLQGTLIDAGPNAGKPEPISIGQMRNITPVLYDPTYLIYYVGSSAVDVTTAPVVYDGGVALTRVITTLGAAMDATQTTITLSTPGTGFPTSGIVRVEDEYITYTGKSSYTLTGCTRGYNSTATSHSNGTQINGGDYTYYNTTAEIWLASTPTYQITADVNGELDGASFVNTTDEAIEYFVVNKGPMTAAELNLGSGTQQIAMWITEETTIADILDQMAKAGRFWWQFERDSGLRTDVFWIATVPSGAVLTLTDADLLQDISYRMIVPPRWRTKIGWNRNYTPLQRDQLAGSVTDADAADFEKEYDIETYEVTSIQTRHLNAVDMPMEPTFYTDATEVASEAQNRQLLWQTQKREITAVTSIGPARCWPGDWVEANVTGVMTTCMVIGTNEDLINNTVTLTLLRV